MKQAVRRFDAGFLIVLAIVILVLWPFLSRPGLPQETDAELHIFRLAELSYLIRGGELYPRWAPNFYHGYGYPIFNYYAPLTYYVGLAFELLPRLGPVEGIKGVFVLGLLMAAVGIYGFVGANWGRPAGYVAAAVYLYAPYIQYIDPHVRGVAPETFSFGIFPVALWALDNLRRRATGGRWLAAVTAVAATILSHNLMGLLFYGLLGSWVVWTTGSDLLPKRLASGEWPEMEGKKGRLLLPTPLSLRPFLPLLALFVGLSLATFFWLPVILERSAVNLNTLLGQGDNYDFRTHFLSLRELLSPSLKLDWGAAESAFRFNLGVAQWLLGAVGLVLLATKWATRRAQGLFFALALAALLFMILPASEFVWESFSFLPYFQFPWRFLGAIAALLAILAGMGIAALLSSPWFQPARRAAGLTAVAVVLPILLGLPLSQPTPWPDFGPVTLLRMTTIELKGRWLGTTSTSDYLPATVDTIPRRNQAVVSGFAEGRPLDRVNRASLPAAARVDTAVIRPLHTRYFVTSPKKFPLRLFQFDFPGWQVHIDGQRVATELGRPEGFLVIPVPAGEHIVDVAFGSTPARTLAGAITLLGWLGALGLAWRLSRASGGDERAYAAGPLTSTDRAVAGAVVLATAVALLLTTTGWLHDSSNGLEAQPAAVPLYADFGQQIALLGYNRDPSQPQPGDALTIALYWKAQRPLEINYQSFVHVLNAAGVLVAQSDTLNPGNFPTRRWPLDKYVRDDHVVPLPADLPPGRYTVVAGLWVQSEGWRLPLLDAAGQQIDDGIILQSLEIGQAQ